MKRKFTLLTLFLLLLVAVLPVGAQDEFVFGMILVGPRDDGGWSQAHYEGGLFAQENVEGARMLLFESLNPADSPEATLESVARDMIDAGARIIFTTSDSFEQDTDIVAALFPDIVFINISGSNALETKAYEVYPDLLSAPAEPEETPANVGNLMAAMEWYKSVAGCAAALMTETGQIAYLGPLINAETRRYTASSYLGARYCYENYRMLNPDDLRFVVTWIGFWFNIPGVTLDPTEEVGRFFDGGADVVLSGIDTTQAVVVAGQRAARGERVFSVAYDSVVGCDEAPDTCLGVPFYNWGPSYAELIEAVRDGTWTQEWIFAEPTWDINSIVGYKFGDGLDEQARIYLEDYIATMQAFALDEANAGRIFLWEGPLFLQDGTQLAAEGEPVSLLEIWYLPQLLLGMEGASN